MTVLSAVALALGSLAVSAPAQALEDGVSVTVQARQLAGEPFLAVRVTNDSNETLRARVEAPVATSVKSAVPGSNAYWAVKLREDAPLTGEARVAVQQLVDGRLVKETFVVEYDATS